MAHLLEGFVTKLSRQRIVGKSLEEQLQIAVGISGGGVLKFMVVWNMWYFFHILGIVIPTDELIFFRGVDTTNQLN
jgi:hypothetical protein